MIRPYKYRVYDNPASINSHMMTSPEFHAWLSRMIKHSPSLTVRYTEMLEYIEVIVV